MATIVRPVFVRSVFHNPRTSAIAATSIYCRSSRLYSVSQQRLASVTSAGTPQPESTPTSTSIPSSASTPPPPPPHSPPLRSRTRRFLSATALVLLFSTAGFIMAAQPAVETLHKAVVAPPTDAETLTMFEPSSENAREINSRLVNSALAQALRADPSYVESRPHLKIPPAMRHHNLTGGTLAGDEKLAVPPLNFLDAEAPDRLPSLVQLVHLGPMLCGHPGVIHGGLLATLLDEGLARACFPALPNKIGVTASLKLDYKKPCLADSFVVLRAQTTKLEGRKVWVKGWIEVLGDGVEEGEHLVEAEALFIEPRGAKNMAKLYSPN